MAALAEGPHFVRRLALSNIVSYGLDQPLNLEKARKLEEKVSPFVDPKVLSEMKEELGEKTLLHMLNALEVVKRGGNDDVYAALEPEGFVESDLDHCVDMIRKADQLGDRVPRIAEMLGNKKEQFRKIFVHDLVEPLVGDTPAFKKRNGDLDALRVEASEKYLGLIFLPHVARGLGTSNEAIRIWRDAFADVTNYKQHKSLIMPSGKIIQAPRRMRGEPSDGAVAYRFLDKWSGTWVAFNIYYPNCSKAVREGRITEEALLDHQAQSMGLVIDAADALSARLRGDDLRKFQDFTLEQRNLMRSKIA